MRLKVGLGQMAVVGGDWAGNMARAEAMIAEASRQACTVVVLPECLDAGWTHPSSRKLAMPVPGRASERLCDSAAAHGIHVVAGLTERAGEGIYNTAVMIDPAGDIRLRHRKIHILDIARDLYSPGDNLGVAEMPWGRTGLLICADAFPEMRALGDSLAHMGATTIFSPCAWAVPPDHDNAATPYGELWRGAYGALTRDHPLAIFAASNVGLIGGGPWEGHSCIGCSLAVGGGGKIIAEGPYGEEAEALVVADWEI